MADQEFLASFGVDIDESGVSRLESIMESLKTKADETATSFEKANSAVSGFPPSTSDSDAAGSSQSSSGSKSATSLTEAFSSVFSGIYDTSIGIQASLQSLFSSSSGLMAGLDLSEAEASLSDLKETAEIPMELSADASGAVSSAEDALSSIRSLFSSADLSVNVKVNTITGGDGDNSGNTGRTPTASRRMSTGGRFTSPSDVQVAEDGGTEYIIPLKSESVALPLLRSLFGELSGSAKESLLSSLSPAGTLVKADPARETGAATAGVSAALSFLPNVLSGTPGATTISILNNNTNHVQAPVSIQVTASGSDPGTLGRSIYDSAERYLLKSLQSVLK